MWLNTLSISASSAAPRSSAETGTRQRRSGYVRRNSSTGVLRQHAPEPGPSVTTATASQRPALRVCDGWRAARTAASIGLDEALDVLRHPLSFLGIVTQRLHVESQRGHRRAQPVREVGA